MNWHASGATTPTTSCPKGKVRWHSTHAARCILCLQEIAERHRGDMVVVVTYGLVLDTFCRAAQGMALGEPRPVPLLNASVNVFRYSGSAWRLEIQGDVAHLLRGDHYALQWQSGVRFSCPHKMS